MVRNFLGRLRSDSGQAVVELAFVLPLVMLILFGIIDFGLALNNYNADTNLANLAARSASVMGATTTIPGGCSSQTNLTGYVTCEAAATGAPKPTYVCYLTGAGTSTLAAGDSLKVEVQSTFGWLRILTGSNKLNLSSSITASATNRIEQGSGSSNTFFSTSSICSS